MTVNKKIPLWKLKLKRKLLFKKVQMLYCWKQYYITGPERMDMSKPEITNLNSSVYRVQKVTVEEKEVVKEVLLVDINVNGSYHPVSRFYNTYKTEAQIYTLTQEIKQLNETITEYEQSRSNR